jgi:hypothetical protein
MFVLLYHKPKDKPASVRALLLGNLNEGGAQHERKEQGRFVTLSVLR